MARENFNELLAFVTVARAGSFTRAAAELQVSQSALSHTIRALEQRFDLRLLTRTTRSVAPTEAGTRLLATLMPRFQEIEAALLAVTHLRERPAGSLRIGAPDHAADTILLPALARLLPDYPEISVEIVTPGAPCDATIRLGEHLARDTVAVPIGRDLRMALVAAPGYFARLPAPALPQQLTSHSCIALRTSMTWEFVRDGYPVSVRVEGQLVCENAAQARLAALAGLGLAWVLEDLVQEDMARGTLVRVLEDWCAPFAGYHLYYPQQRAHDAAFALLLDALANGAATGRP